MINVLFNSEVFRLQKFGGISRYFSELIKGIINDNISSIPQKFFSQNKHLRLNGQTYFNQLSDWGHFRGKSRIERFLEKKEDKTLLDILKKGKFDIYHPTYYNSSFINEKPPGKPFILTVYDMIHEMYIDSYFENISSETKNKKLLIPLADHIITISQSTKNDIIRFFPEIEEKKISVVYLGSSFSVNNLESKVSLPSKYVLFVGNRGYYKNFAWFLNAIAAFLHRRKISLVCAGGGVFTEYEHSLISKADLSDKVHYYNINDDGDLVTLYKRAACFIFPSLYEGFGIPILEAFSCGCPVILPNSSCFPEIAESAALYYELNNAQNLVGQLSRILDDSSLSENLKDAGFKRGKLFSWDETVKQHIKIYNAIGAP